MEDRLVVLCYNALSILIPALCAILIELIRRKLGLEKMRKMQQELETKKDLAHLAVRMTEQVYQNLHGQDKFDRASEWLTARARERGLNINSDELQGLIEAALRMANDEFSKQWGKQVTVSKPEKEAG